MSVEHTHTHSHSHAHSAHHDHTHGMARNTLRTAFFLTIVILLAGLLGGIFSHSLAMLSDAGHTLTDLFALGLAWFAAIQSERPSNERKTFGYHRVGILVALLNAVILIIIAILIAWEAIQRFQHPTPVQPLIMFVAAAIAIVINLFIGFGLQKDSHNLNIRAASLHVFGDVGASVGVILGGVIILLTGWTFVDPLLSVAIALYIAYGAWGIVRETTDILLEAVPKEISLEQLVGDMKQIQGVNAVHDLHVWCIASGMLTLSCHISTTELSGVENARLLTEVNSLLQSKYNISHATIQCECKDHQQSCCQETSLYCCLISNSSAHNHDHGNHNHDYHEHEQVLLSSREEGNHYH
ncbi:cation diffusion facilitator family transporter [Dictyobacter arantiisoli]|uniref:Cation transporter n=1 Tax=Dictyobacter arantiisoli TaxID=2014874 RepID=A0A5A5TAP3_9CHLR|nr:cation diffusion facilitator family transporter [Dictyobacter arantiisoli]GCF07974.1 cation transporter [Dictyobacter arantiisoli]